jgi:perosamine synthetase
LPGSSGTTALENERVSAPRDDRDPPIPVYVPSFGDHETSMVSRAAREGWITSHGPYVQRFERRFTRFVRGEFGIATSSGTAALHVALAALEVGPGDEVIVPDFTMVACLDAVLYTGASPVLVDVDPGTWTLDVDLTEQAVTPRTKAIMPVHVYGHPVDMDPLRRVAQRHRLAIVEDAAEAHGSEYRGTPVGALGDLGCFSFYSNKIIATGEGGMVVTRSARLAEKVERLHELAYESESRNYRHTGVGFNYRLTDLQAAVGLAQLDRLREFVRHRRRCARIYREVLESVEGVELQAEASWAKSAYWTFTILLKGGSTQRDQVAAELLRQRVGSRVAFWPLHRQSFVAKRGLSEGRFEVSDRLGEGGLTLPFGNGITEETVSEVAHAVRSAARLHPASAARNGRAKRPAAAALPAFVAPSMARVVAQR